MFWGFVCFLSSSLNPLWILAESRWLIFPSLQAEVFLPVIVLISPKEQGPAGAGAPARPRDKAHSRAPPGRGQGRGGAALRGQPAGRSYQAARHRPPPPPAGQSGASAARAHEPRRHQSERDPTAGAWHRARTRTSRAGQSAGRACAARRLARSLARGALTREAPPPPPHAAPVRAPLPHAPRRARQLSSPATASAPAPPPTPAARGWWGGGMGPPQHGRRRSPQPPPPLSVQSPPRREGASLKSPLEMATGVGWRGAGMRRRGLTRVQPPPGSAGAGGRRREENVGRARASCGRGGAAWG